MMLHPESLQIEDMGRFSVHEGGQAPYQLSSNQVEAHNDSSSKTRALVESLIPEGVSPAKRAVIERLVTLWLADPKLDVA